MNAQPHYAQVTHHNLKSKIQPRSALATSFVTLRASVWSDLELSSVKAVLLTLI